MPVDRSAVPSADPSHEDAVDPRRKVSPEAPLDHRSGSPSAPSAPTDPGPSVTVVARPVDRCRGQRR